MEPLIGLGIMLTARSELAEAVVFFDRGQLSREMLLSEFEAILDAVVPMAEFSSDTAKAVYVRINSKLQVTAAVFFLLSFDADGIADKRWNVPLQQLADNSSRGPDLGAGPIRLACHSQCSVAWHQKNLWNPEMTASLNNFVQLKKAIASNRLGLVFEAEEVVPVAQHASAQTISEPAAAKVQPPVVDAAGLKRKLSSHYKQQFEQEFRNRMAQLLKEQRLKVSTLISEHKKNTLSLQRKNLHRLDGLRAQLDESLANLQASEQRNLLLKETIDGQAEKIQGLREYFEHKLEAQETDGAGHIKTMHDNYQLELEAKIVAATTELKETLEMRDFELMYRNEQEQSLREELEKAQQENQNLIANSGEELLQTLSDAGLNFIAYHPGAGHITITVDDMSEYLADQEAFAANRCGVSVSHYRQWLQHHQNPCCAALTSKGEACGARIVRVMEPSEFHLGEGDRCETHQSCASQLFKAGR